VGLFVKFMIGATGLAITFNFLWHSLLGLDLAGFFFSSFAMLILVVIVMFRALVLDAEVPVTEREKTAGEKKRDSENRRVEAMIDVVLLADQSGLAGGVDVAITAWVEMIRLFRSPRDVDFMDDYRWERLAAAFPVAVSMVAQDRATRLRLEDDWSAFLLTLKTTGRSNLDDPRKV